MNIRKIGASQGRAFIDKINHSHQYSFHRTLPLFFPFTEVKPWINRIGICLGCIFGPLFYLLNKDSSLLVTGLVAGTIAYYIDRKILRKRPGLIG